MHIGTLVHATDIKITRTTYFKRKNTHSDCPELSHFTFRRVKQKCLKPCLPLYLIHGKQVYKNFNFIGDHTACKNRLFVLLFRLFVCNGFVFLLWGGTYNCLAFETCQWPIYDTDKFPLSEYNLPFSNYILLIFITF